VDEGSGHVRILKITLRALLQLVFVLGIITLLWVGSLRYFDVPVFVGKGPQEVWDYLFTVSDAAANRAAISEPLQQTLLDATVGFVAGMLAAIALASGIVLSRGVEAAVMPMAMVLRSVPLIALAPIIALIFGNGYAVVAAMSGIVVLFPALVNIVFGLRSVSPQMSDLVSVYGGNNWVALRRVGFPSALPSLFASLRISVPGAITGALLAESLSTGKGIGNAVVVASASSSNSEVWALVTVVTVVSVVLYMAAQLLEGIVLTRFGKAG
jgi:ABC-type nitrate/sulfonate/bicarbonate transport system permease component